MKRFLLLSIAALLFAAAYSLNAHATGGGYTSTKHGGGTTDTASPCPTWGPGVNRALGMGTGTCATSPVAGSFYYDVTEGGKYSSGECAHCHEPHASFGNAAAAPYDPPPNTAPDAGPKPYLLMKDYTSGTLDSYSLLCWYCHENISNINGSGSLTGYGKWGFYQGKVNYQASSHYKNSDGGTAMNWPGISGTPSDTIAAWPRQSRADSSGNRGGCLNCHTPHGVSGSYDNGTPANAATDFAVGTASGLIPRQTIAREEALCLRCHNAAVASTQIKTQVDNFLAAAGSGHPVRKGAYYGRHNLANESNNKLPATGWFTSASAHAECTDCHNPHVVWGAGSSTTGGYANPWGGGVFQWSQTSATGLNSGGVWNPNRYSATANHSKENVRLAAQNRGVWGVTVSSLATGAITNPTTTSFLNSWADTTPNYVYDLCLKCHSYWAWNGTSYLPGTGTFSVSNITAPSTDGALRTNDGSKVTAWSATPTAGVPLNYPLTDVAGEFATNNISYHPVFSTGKNTPEKTGVRNPKWCTEATATYSASDTCTSPIGARSDLAANVSVSVTYKDGTTATVYPEQTLSQTFVQPWLHTSRITCTDCHEDNGDGTLAASIPRGPHGSTRPFILRVVDPNISISICTTAASTQAGACGAVGAVTYSSYAGLGTGGADSATFCFNCHRADVYSNGTYGTSRATFSRQPHPPAGKTNNEGLLYANTTNPRNGISCMGCHGGGPGVVDASTCTTGNCKLGNIHGNSYNTARDNVTATVDGKDNRLIAPGANWQDFKRGTTAAVGYCSTAAQSNARSRGWSGCGQHTASVGYGNFAVVSTYNYTE